MSGKARLSLRSKTLENVIHSNLSNTDKECICEVFKRHEKALTEREERQKGCCYCKQKSEWGICNYYGKANSPHIILYCPMCGRNLKEDKPCSDT